MTADLDDVVVALAARISTGLAAITLGGRTYAYAVDSPNPPCAIVLPSSGDFVAYDVTMDGADNFELTVKLLVSAAYSKTGQTELLGYLSRSGSTSVRAAIYGDRTLGGTVADLKVEGARSYGDVEWAGVVFFGAELVVTAYS
jgi:hypothetical protein